MAKFGSPHNRYGFNGTFVNGPVLHILGLLFKSLRSLIRSKNFTKKDLFELHNSNAAMHEKIISSKIWMIDPRMMLERLYANRYHVGEGEALRGTFSNMNFAFFDARVEGEKSFGGQHFLGSPLYNHLVRLAKLDPSVENQEIVAQLRDWASQNIHMSQPVRGELGLPKKQGH